MKISDPNTSRNDSTSAEDTLRLIANLPAPAGLEDRIQTGLLAHAHSARRAGRVLAWPATSSAGSAWMRSAAAAAIVFVVAGGGWGIYSRVQQPQAAKVIVMPHVSAPGEFTNAGAMRTPKTLNAPIILQPAEVKSAPAKPSAKAVAKPSLPKTVKSAANPSAAADPAAPAAK